MSAELPLARCCHLRTKALYVSAMAANAFAGGDEQAAQVCWCNATLRELGPDGEPVDLQSCSDAGRECYQARPGARG